MKIKHNGGAAYTFALALLIYGGVIIAMLVSGHAAHFVEARFLPLVAAAALFLLLAAGLQIRGLLKGNAFSPRTGLPVLILPLLFSLVAAEYRSPLSAARFGTPLDPATFDLPPETAPSPNDVAPAGAGAASGIATGAGNGADGTTGAATGEGELAKYLTAELYAASELPAIGRIEFDDRSYYTYYNEIYDAMESMVGREIRVTGFVHREEHLGGNQFIVARMMLWCCTADAMMLGFHGSYDQGRIPPENTWVDVTGTLEVASYHNPHTRGDYSIPSIRVSSIAPADEPEFEYVIPF
ncbi:MAG: TIGR03943 family protein [Spirochaetia bacterium]